MNTRANRSILVSIFVAALALWAPLSASASHGPADGASGNHVSLKASLSGSAVDVGADRMRAGGPLSKAQILRLAQNATRRVIIILRDQFPALHGRTRDRLSARTSAVSDAQNPILAQLHAVHAKDVLPFHIIDAVRATISAAEEARLQSDPAVRAVVPDAVLPAPNLHFVHDGLQSRTSVRSRFSAALDARRQNAVPKCADSKPQLQPEALAVTHTAYLNSRMPQAQSYATGAGVTVAIVSGPIDPFNPDFIRPDGQPVITDYENFGGDLPNTPGGGGGWDLESFLDMSSVAAQGNDTYNLNDWAYNLGNDCSTVRILGMAPGANVMWLDAVGEFGETTSNFVQAIQYAVDNGANVISESWGTNYNNDTGLDAATLADEQATADGLTVVVSSGDAGAPNSTGTPANVSSIISAGASTTEQFNQLIGYLKAQHLSGYVDNNVVAFSSSGVTQMGNKTVDIVAPGAFGFMDCTPDPVLFPGCTGPTGLPINFFILGGTSESAPLTAGEAALVIQGYESTHHGQAPSSATVKQIIMSTATDLDDPSWEQGAGLINSFRAVLAARSWDLTSRDGHALVTSPGDLTATGLPRSAVRLAFRVRNDGSQTETVSPAARRLGPPTVRRLYTVNVRAGTANAVACANILSAYDLTSYCPPEATISFRVPVGVDRLEGDLTWNVVKQPFGIVELQLIDPKGRYADNTEPSDAGPPIASSGYGEMDIARPTPGVWQAQIFVVTFDPQAPLYHGPVHVQLSTSKFVTAGTVLPASRVLAPGQSGDFMLDTYLPASAGDASADVAVVGHTGVGVHAGAGTIPVILRSLVPTTSSGGRFSGDLTGGGGGFALYSYTYEFRVPFGLSSLALGVTLPDKNDNLQGVLVDPEGYAINIESTISRLDTDPSSDAFGLPTRYSKGLQLYQVNPPAGLWRFELEIDDNVSGAFLSTPFTGTITFNGKTVTARGLPDSLSTKVAAGSSLIVPVVIRNTGNAPKSFFTDARLQTLGGYAVSTQVHLPLNQPPFDPNPSFLVPPQTTELALSAESVGTSKTPSSPIMFDAWDNDGAPPYGPEADPDLESSPSFNPATGDYSAGLTFSSSYELPQGQWMVAPSPVGPFPNGASHSLADVGALLITREFDPSIDSSTGDLWSLLMGAGSNYSPATLAPGKSVTLRITITPQQTSGSAVRGTLFIDAFAATPDFPYDDTSMSITGSGDEVAALPYAYTVK